MDEKKLKELKKYTFIKLLICEKNIFDFMICVYMLYYNTVFK